MLNMRREGAKLTAYLTGEIDHCRAADMRAQIEDALGDKAIRTLTLDFADVTFMDSSGVGMIIGRYKTMKARGGEVIAANMTQPVQRLFRMAGLHRIIQIEGERQDAHE